MRKTGKYHVLTILMIGLFSLAVGRQDEGKSRTETEPINIAVVVKDAAGNRLPGLKKEDFEIYEDGVLQEIADIKPAPRPLRLVLLVDTSVSMGAIFQGIKDEAVKFVENLNQLDEIMIGAFDTDMQLSADWGGKARATTDILDLKSPPSPPPILPQAPSPFPIPRPIPRGRGIPDKDTNLFGALHSLFQRFGARSGNEVVVLISDGKDSLDRKIAKDRPVKDSAQVIREAQQSWTQVYGACFKIDRGDFGPGVPIGGRNYRSDCKFLSEIAGATGGRSFEFESPSALAQVLKKTHDELKNQYTLVYYPSSQGNKAGFHKIRVVVKKPDMTIQARDGYLISR